MFDVIENIINHVYESSYGGSQQYIYYICGAVICVLLAVFVDNIFRIFRKIFKY